MFLTFFAMLTRISCRTQTTISFACKTRLARRFVIAGIICASILRTKKETQST